MEAFTREFEPSASLFSDTPGAKATRSNSQCVDLPEACRRQLLDAGMDAEKIFADGPCTACETDRFFSHRADSANGGRMMSVIGIVGDEAGSADDSSATGLCGTL